MSPLGKIAAVILMIPGVLFLWPASDALLKGQFIDGGIYGALGVATIGIALLTRTRRKAAFLLASAFAVLLGGIVFLVGITHPTSSKFVVCTVITLAEGLATVLFIQAASKPEDQS
jgi:hypothetical protein